MEKKEVEVEEGELFEANGKVEGVSPTVRQCGIKSLGLKALEAYLVNDGYSVEIIMQDEQTIKKLTKKILSLKPKIVGASKKALVSPGAESILRPFGTLLLRFAQDASSPYQYF